jgi:hypothetical protein
MKRDGAYKRIKNNRHAKNGAIIPDALIQLTGTKTGKHYPKAIRKIKYYDKEYRGRGPCGRAKALPHERIGRILKIRALVAIH